MGINNKTIKRRIKSISSTKKVTKAMEMISAVKMRKATQAALNTRVYAKIAKELIDHLSTLNEPGYELLNVRPVKRMLLILISSNKGLCGSFNSNIFKKTLISLKDLKSLAIQKIPGEKDILPEGEVEIDILGVGKKSAYFAKKNNYNLISVFDKLSETPDIKDLSPISKLAIDEYKTGKYDKVIISYTDFKSSICQEAKIRQLLPLSSIELEKMILGTGKENSKVENDIKPYPIDLCIFEPDVETIVETILPRLVEIQLYQSLLESSASEHSARMMAMKNANEAAEEMIKSLNLTYSKARQAAITQEISEIVGGAAALE